MRAALQSFAVVFRPHALHASRLRPRGGVNEAFNARRANGKYQTIVFLICEGDRNDYSPPPSLAACLVSNDVWKSRHRDPDIVGVRCFSCPTESRLKIKRVACRWIYERRWENRVIASLTMFFFFHRWDLLLNNITNHACDVQNLKIRCSAIFCIFSRFLFFPLSIVQSDWDL